MQTISNCVTLTFDHLDTKSQGHRLYRTVPAFELTVQKDNLDAHIPILHTNIQKDGR